MSSEVEISGSAASTGRSGRITLRRVGGGCAGLLIALAILYALLPWLLPKRWLADRIADGIAGVMNRAARIDNLRLSWGEGVVIEGLSIDRRPGFGHGPFLRVRRIQTAFSPLGAVLGHAPGQLDLLEPHVWVVIVTEDGVQRINISDLGAEGTEHAPSGEWSAVNAAIHIVEEGSDREPDREGDGHVELRLGQLACRLDSETGQARWEIHGRLPAGATSQPSEVGGIATDGSLTIPKLKQDVELSGGGRITWDRLDLATLPVHLIPGSSVQRLTGWSEGALDVRVAEDLQVDVQLRTELSDVSVYRRERPRPDRLASAGLSTTGRWNPNADVLVFDALDFRLPGLLVRAQERPDRSPIRLALHGDRRIDLDLKGKVEDLGQLRQSLPELDILLGRETEARGACDFEVSWRRTTEADRLRIDLDATGAALSRPDVVQMPAGQPGSVRFDATIDHRAARLEVHEAQLRFGPIAMHAQGRLPLAVLSDRSNEDALWQLLHGARGEVRVGVQAADRLCEFLPVLAEPLRDVQLVGPMDLTLGMGPGRTDEDVTVFRAYLNVPASSHLAVGETFVMPPGRPLSASVQTTLCREPRGTLRDTGLDLRCGDGRVWIEPAETRARLSVQRVPAPAATHPTSRVASAASERFMAHGYVAAAVHLERVEALLAAMPKLVEVLTKDRGGRGLTGDCTMSVEANAANVAADGEMTPELWRVHADIEADGLGVDLGDALNKPVGKAAVATLDYTYDRSVDRLPHRYGGSFRLAGIEGKGTYAWGGGWERADVEVDVSDVCVALAHVPRLADRAGDYKPSGGGSIRLRSERDPERHVVSVAADAGRLGIRLPGAEPVTKLQGIPCRFDACVESLAGTGGSTVHEMAVRRVEATIASCRIGASDGRIVARPGTHEKLTGDYMSKDPKWWLKASPFQEVRLSTAGSVVFDSTLRSISPVIDRLSREYDLIGRADVDAQLSATSEGIRLAGRIEADRVNIHAPPHLIKAPGTKLGLTFDVASRDQPDRAGTTTGFVVHACGLRAWDMRFDGSGDLWLQHEADATLPRLGGFAMSASYDVPQLSRLQELVPSLSADSLTGQVAGTVSAAFEGEQFQLRTSTLTARDVRTSVGGQPVRIDGQITASSDQIDSEELRIDLGANRLKLAGHVEDVATNPRGTVFVIADEMDFDALREFASHLPSDQATSQPVGPTTRIADGAAAEPTSRPLDDATDDRERMARAQPVFEFLKRCDLAGRLHIGRARLTGEKTRQVFVVDELVSDFKLAAGRVSFPFRCAMNGGMVDGEFTMTADEPNPYFDLKYRGVDVGADDNVKAMVLYDFPGLHASGPVTLIDATHQRFFNEPGVLNHPVGEGDWIINGGAYVGRAAPMWLARIFPGLNTARYEFTRMHDWFEKHVDGRVDHHMIYQGPIYNIYMKGRSMATTGRSHYEVGIDLLAGYESKYWSETGQGRVALFTADARVEDGVEVEKVIRFVPLHRVIYDVFLRSNVVTAAYYALEKRASEQN